jgi:hypothetical protein
MMFDRLTFIAPREENSTVCPVVTPRLTSVNCRRGRTLGVAARSPVQVIVKRDPSVYRQIWQHP